MDRIEPSRTAFSEGDGSPVGDQLRALWFDMAGTPFPAQVPTLQRTLGVDRLVYGSDACWTPAALVRAQVASIDAAAVPGDGRSWRELTTDNARWLLRAGAVDES